MCTGVHRYPTMYQVYMYQVPGTSTRNSMWTIPQGPTIKPQPTACMVPVRTDQYPGMYRRYTVLCLPVPVEGYCVCILYPGLYLYTCSVQVYTVHAVLQNIIYYSPSAFFFNFCCLSPGHWQQLRWLRADTLYTSMTPVIAAANHEILVANLLGSFLSKSNVGGTKIRHAWRVPRRQQVRTPIQNLLHGWLHVLLGRPGLR